MEANSIIEVKQNTQEMDTNCDQLNTDILCKIE